MMREYEEAKASGDDELIAEMEADMENMKSPMKARMDALAHVCSPASESSAARLSHASGGPGSAIPRVDG